MTDFFKAVGAIAAAIVAIIGLLTATGLINQAPSPSEPGTPVRSESPFEPSAAPVEPSAGPLEQQGGPTEPPAGFRVVEAILRADPFEGTQPCPVVVTFSGRISVVGGSGTVAYRFIRSDSASAPIQSLTFDGPGSQDVSETWTIGAPGSQLDEWEAIEVIDPTAMTSDHAEFHITCS